MCHTDMYGSMEDTNEAKTVSGFTGETKWQKNIWSKNQEKLHL